LSQIAKNGTVVCMCSKFLYVAALRPLRLLSHIQWKQPFSLLSATGTSQQCKQKEDSFLSLGHSKHRCEKVKDK